jgi:hypothetical protein
MWRPKAVGTPIAQRSFDLLRGRRRIGRATLRIGLPVREPNPTPDAPWFCPLAIDGGGLDEFVAVGGVDSVQALVLALELASTRISEGAAGLKATAEWLEDSERLILARHTIALGADNALTALLGRLKQASAILDTGAPSSARARVRAMEALNLIGASVGGRIASRPKRKKSQPRSKRR